ncbi:AraC family transcriptional regulator [Sulfitobacter sp. D35]|uniref:helix-turn-helix domain-containing protein n=1 Tax=Sulfitobacter sp. D35 TaxID=3083252 RepID=UPI00296F41AE|nr:AraC family transcriptional regulator [Sulfitobacter sp. D35]MDW4497865.1 AraC family transcriptional regulator [Sulfitobacter sp. D35]
MAISQRMAERKRAETFLSGQGWIDAARKIDRAAVVVRPEVEIECARFTIADHSSEINPSEVATLALSTSSDGQLRTEISGVAEDSRIRPGTLTFVPPGNSQTFDFTGKTTNTLLSIRSSILEKVASVGPGLGTIGGLEPRPAFNRPALHRLVEEQYAVMSAGDNGWRVLSESIALRIACELLTIFNGEPAKKPDAPPISAAEIERLIDFIDAELESNFGLSDLARVIDRDPFGFSRSFKAATGESPHQYVIQRRLMKVKELLQHTDNRLVDITYATGFSNQAHMTTTFSKHFGMPPGAWRRMVRQ